MKSNMFSRCYVVVLLIASTVCAAEWASPDRKVAFEAPASDEFTAAPTPPAPLIAQWSSRDGSTNIAFLTTPNPQNARLVQAALAVGCLNVSGGSVVSSTQTNLSGIPAYSIFTHADKT